ncbi:hypothetical protein [Actinomyces radicidentis]|uniref:hypothetical protein n=1 Tax=Actinomyces radicidentis TaxID=111015 RepID=UPI0028E739F0|nr:hypothetical protein [Actinomyces radicidentis]
MGTATAKKFKQVKVRGLLVDPPDGGEPRGVYVNEDDGLFPDEGVAHVARRAGASVAG